MGTVSYFDSVWDCAANRNGMGSNHYEENERMKTKEQIDDICRRMNNQLETLRKYSGAEIHDCRSLMNWFVNQVPNIQFFYEPKMWDNVDEIYESSEKLMDEAAAFIRKHKLY